MEARDGSNNVIFGDRIWEKGRNNIRVEYHTSYNSDLMPVDITRAATEETARAFYLQNTESVAGARLGITQRGPEAGTSLTFTPDDFSPATLRVLNTYRQSRFE